MKCYCSQAKLLLLAEANIDFLEALSGRTVKGLAKGQPARHGLAPYRPVIALALPG